jgi:hypothetical protein
MCLLNEMVVGDSWIKYMVVCIKYEIIK